MGIVYWRSNTSRCAQGGAQDHQPGMDSRQVIAVEPSDRPCRSWTIRYCSRTGRRDDRQCRPYFVMELVNGSRHAVCDEQHLTAANAWICSSHLPAVQHAPESIIHRDLKPSNILVALYDVSRFPKSLTLAWPKQGDS